MRILLPIACTLLLAGAAPDADEVRLREILARADVARAGHRIQVALAAYREAHALVREVCGEESVEEARVLYGLGSCLPPFAKTEEAITHLRRALRIAERRTGPDSRLAYVCRRTLSTLLVASSRFREALPLARRTLAGAPRFEAAGSEALENARLRLARAELECGRPWEAERLYRKALRGPKTAEAWVGIGRVRIALGRYDEAEMYLRKAFDLAGHGLLRACEGYLLADAVEKRGRKAEADALRKELSAVWRQVG